MTQQDPTNSAAAAGEVADSLRQPHPQGKHSLPSPATPPYAVSIEDAASQPADPAGVSRHANNQEGGTKQPRHARRVAETGRSSGF